MQPDLHIPTPEEEAANPAAADQVYESYVDFLKEATRDVSAFPMVFTDNVNYGFRRNLWAIKPWGITTSLIGTAAATTKVLQQWIGSGAISITAVASLGACILALILFIVVVTKGWVRQAGDAYARRLVESLERLKGEQVESSIGIVAAKRARHGGRAPGGNLYA